MNEERLSITVCLTLPFSGIFAQNIYVEINFSFSKSMDEGHSDLDDILNADMNLNITKPSPQMPTSILKHRSDSNVPQAIRKGGYQNGGRS